MQRNERMHKVKLAMEKLRAFERPFQQSTTTLDEDQKCKLGNLLTK